MGKITFKHGVAPTSQVATVSKVVEKFEDASLKNGTRKQRTCFTRLSPEDKRAWRESLQRAIAAIKNRNVARVLRGIRPRGRTAIQLARISKLEERMIDTYSSVSFQTGVGKVAKMAGIAGGALLAAGATVRLSGVAEATTSAASSVKSLADQASGIMSQFIDCLTRMAESLKAVGGLLWKIALGCVVYWIINQFTSVPVLVAATVAVASGFVPELKQMFEDLIQKGGVKPQTGLTTALADIVALACCVWVPGRDVKAISGEFMKRATYLPRASEGIEKFFEKSLKLVEQFINWVMRRTADNWISVGQRSTLYDIWKRKVIDWLKRFATSSDIPIEELKEAQSVLADGYGFLHVLVSPESKRDVLTWIEKLRLSLAPHQGALTAAQNVRAMPYCFMIGGPSGVGKSTLIRLLSTFVLILSGECKAKEAMSNLWQKGTTEYWNGYVGQKCLVMDDAFQTKPQKGQSDSEAMQVIRAIGNWSYPLNFADVESKGKFYLDCPLVVGTTNARNVAAEWEPYITCPEALVRRFHGAYWVTVSEKFATPDGKLDYVGFNSTMNQLAERVVARLANGEQLTEKELMDSIPWDAWEMRRHTFDTSEIKGETVSLRHAVETAAAEIRYRRKTNNEEVGSLQKLLDALDDAKFQSGVGTHPVVVADRSEESVPINPLRLYRERAFDMRTSTVQLPTIWEEEEKQEGVFRRLYDAVVGTVKGLYKHFIGTMTDSEWATKLADMLGTATMLAAAVGIFAGIVRASWSVLNAILRLFGLRHDDEVVPQSNVPPTRVGTENVKLKSWIVPKVFEQDAKHQVGVPPNERVHSIIYDNTLKVYMEGADGWQPLGQFIGIGSDVYVFPSHFLPALRTFESSARMRWFDVRDSCYVDVAVGDFLARRFITKEGFDVAAVSLGQWMGFKARKKILKYFLPERDVYEVVKQQRHSVRLDIAYVSNHDKPRVRQETLVSPFVEASGVAIGGEHTHGLVHYTAPTEVGHCGAPLTLAENRYFKGKCLLGFHVAGRDNRHMRDGYGAVVTLELATYFFDVLSSYTEGDLEAGTGNGDGFEYVPTHGDAVRESGLVAGSMQYLGKLNEPVHVPTRTALKPSAMQDDQVFGPSPTAPAVLTPVEKDGVKVYPMVKALEAYQSPVIYKNPDELEPIVTLAMKKHWEATEKSFKGLLSFKESVEPPEGLGLKGLNRKTSAGYKYRRYVKPALPGKTAFFGFEGDIDFTNPLIGVLEADVEDIVTKAKAGERKLHLFTDFLKDELRPLEKVANVQTRSISGAPLDYTLAVRRYFGAFIAACLNTYVANGMAPGINFYREWATLAESLIGSGRTKFFDGDFKRFDASEQPWVHAAILRYINRWYARDPTWSPEDDTVRTILWMDLVHSRHISGFSTQLDTVVQWNKSLPSGHPMTTIVNSMYSLITLTGCYVRATEDLTHMWDKVYLCTFGDDNINAVDDDISEVFNQETVARDMMDLFSLTYTSGRKGAELEKYTSLDNVTFLKRSFAPDLDYATAFHKAVNVVWVAPIALESFLWEGYWYKNARDPAGDLATRCDLALCELSLHDQATWDKYFPLFRSWCDANSVPLQYDNRAGARHHLKTRFEMWF